MTWKYFVGYHQIVPSQIRDEVHRRCLPNLAQLAKTPWKVKQILLKAELFTVCKHATQSAQICLSSVPKPHWIPWAEQRQTAPSLVHSGSVFLWAEDDRWVSEGRSNKPVFIQNRWLQYPIQTVHRGCGCRPSAEAATATAEQGVCTVTPNPDLEWVHCSSSAQPRFHAEQGASWANRPGFILSTGHKCTLLYSPCVMTEYFNIWISMPPAPQPTYIPRVTKKSSKITATAVYVYEVWFSKAQNSFKSKSIFRGTLKGTSSQWGRFPYQISNFSSNHSRDRVDPKEKRAECYFNHVRFPLHRYSENGWMIYERVFLICKIVRKGCI